MKKLSILTLIFTLLLTSCGDKGTGILNLRIGGGIPVGTTSCLITLTDTDGNETPAEYSEEERELRFSLPADTYTLSLSFLGADGQPHAERRINDIKIAKGQERGLTIRFPEKIADRGRLLSILPSAEFGEPDPEIEESLRESDITLTLWHAESGIEEAALLALIDVFNEENEWGIEVIPMYQGDNNVLHMKTMASLTADTAPDIVCDRRWRVNEYLPSGRLLDITDYIHDGYGLNEEELFAVNPVFYMDNWYEDGRMYSTCLGKYAEVLFYNEDFLSRNGISVPQTLTELTENARDASKITGKPSFGVSDILHEGLIGPICFGSGYSKMDGAEFYRGVNIANTYSYYEWWKAGVDRAWFRTKGDDLSIVDPFLRKSLVFFTGPSTDAWRMTESDFKVGITPLPMGRTPAVHVDGNVFAGFSSGDDMRDLAVSIVLEWFYSEEASEIWSSFTGAIPSNRNAIDGAIENAGDWTRRILEAVSTYTPIELYCPPVSLDSRQILKALSIPVEGAEKTSDTIDMLIDRALVALDEI